MSEVERVLDLARRLVNRGEQDVIWLLVKATDFNQDLLFQAADTARRERSHLDYEWESIADALDDAAVEALRGVDNIAERPVDNQDGPRCPEVTVDLDAVKGRSDNIEEPFVRTLTKAVSFVLQIANQNDVYADFKGELRVAFDEEWPVPDIIVLCSRYVNVTYAR